MKANGRTINKKEKVKKYGQMARYMKDNKPVENVYQLSTPLPALSQGAVTVHATFKQKNVEIVDEKSKDYSL